VSAGSNFASSGSGRFSSFGGGGSGINEYVDEALLARVAAVIASNGDGTSSGGQDNEGSRYVDGSILARVASSLEGQGSSRSTGGYGVPSASSSSSSGQLGQPVAAQRIAEWDLSAQGNQGGYSTGSAQSFSSGASSGGSFSRPEPAQQVAEFDASPSQGSSVGFSSGGGYN
jgi:hypothetical protein